MLETESGRGAKFAELNRAICGLIEDFALVSFETLCVEVRPAAPARTALSSLQDKESMAALVKAVDAAIGYFPPHPASTGQPSREQFDPSLLLRTLDPMAAANRSRDVQERYVDEREAYREHEREGWRREGEMAMARANAESLAAAQSR